MANTYTQLYIHVVFAVKYRRAMLDPKWDERLRLYITGTVQNNGHQMLAINNVADHIHFLVGLAPTQSISELLRLVKCDSSEWINKERLTAHKVRWQEGYGAFSHSRSQLNGVIQYIRKQQEHHSKTPFRDEYKKMLTDFGVEHNDRYIFTHVE